MTVTVNEFIQYIAWVVYMAIFVSVVIEAVRRPLRANIDIALFFSVAAAIIILGVLVILGIEPNGPITVAVDISLLLALIYMLQRLVNDFSHVPVWFMRASEVALVLLVVGAFWYTPNFPVALTLTMLAYLIVPLLYAVTAFGRESVRTTGVTRRRMRAAAVGSIFLCLEFIILGLGIPFPELSGLWGTLAILSGLMSGVFYFLGFAAPGFLRRAWQEPELRSFLGRAATLPRLPSTEAIVAELEKGAATSLGASDAKIGLWDEDEQVLRFTLDGSAFDLPADSSTYTARAFVNQQPMFTDDLPRDNPSVSQSARERGVVSLISAPITANERRLGVLVVYAAHSPVFAMDDMNLVQLLADQAAVILESRALIDEAARVRAREEVARLKEDFLSAAAHDLKTPLTTLMAQAQLMERRAERNPDAPADPEGLRKLVREAKRLKNLVLELLDAARAEEGRLVGELVAVDLVAVAAEVCSRYNSKDHPCKLEAPVHLVGNYDPARIHQLFENLIENAVKYSPDGGSVVVGVWADGDRAHVTVTDHGIGIPKEDLPHIFDRFHRGKNVDDRRFAGMGLGLYICREIVTQHGGRIEVSSDLVHGTTFTAQLPLLGLGAHETDGKDEMGNVSEVSSVVTTYSRAAIQDRTSSSGMMKIGSTESKPQKSAGDRPPA